MSGKHSNEETSRKIRVVIIGAGISGLALAHGLLNDPGKRFEVCIYERDTLAFDMDRGGYQLRMAAGGIDALKNVTNLETWRKLQMIWEGDSGKAPAMVDPKTQITRLNLSEVKIYPKSCGVARLDLKYVLLQRLEREGIVKFSHPFAKYELVASNQIEGEHEVILHFQNPDTNPPVRADILIAADGSNSRVNRQAGINNKAKLNSWTLIQSRGEISSEVYNKLPNSLRSQKSTMFLAGAKYSGFASVYKQLNLPDNSDSSKGNHQMFWSALIPKQVGDEIVKTAGEDKAKLIKLLSEYVTTVLKYDPKGLPFIYNSAVDHVRSGSVTTSLKPTQDWRGGKAANSRIIIIGDAIHPMTPGRGMGANQALMDAGSLTKLIRTTPISSQGPSDGDMHLLAAKFDAEMYDRAFKMVKASEDMTSLDLTTTSGIIKLTIGKTILSLIGFVVSTLELFGLYKQEGINFNHPDETSK